MQGIKIDDMLEARREKFIVLEDENERTSCVRPGPDGCGWCDACDDEADRQYDLQTGA